MIALFVLMPLIILGGMIAWGIFSFRKIEEEKIRYVEKEVTDRWGATSKQNVEERYYVKNE